MSNSESQLERERESLTSTHTHTLTHSCTHIHTLTSYTCGYSSTFTWLIQNATCTQRVEQVRLQLMWHLQRPVSLSLSHSHTRMCVCVCFYYLWLLQVKWICQICLNNSRQKFVRWVLCHVSCNLWQTPQFDLISKFVFDLGSSPLPPSHSLCCLL